MSGLGPPRPGGGLWVVEPDERLYRRFLHMMAEGQPSLTGNWGNETLAKGPDGKQLREVWRLSDMELVRWRFTRWSWKFSREPLFPQLHDDRHGYVSGLRFIDRYKHLNEQQFKDATRVSGAGQGRGLLVAASSASAAAACSRCCTLLPSPWRPLLTSLAASLHCLHISPPRSFPSRRAPRACSWRRATRAMPCVP